MQGGLDELTKPGVARPKAAERTAPLDHPARKQWGVWGLGQGQSHSFKILSELTGWEERLGKEETTNPGTTEASGNSIRNRAFALELKTPSVSAIKHHPLTPCKPELSHLSNYRQHRVEVRKGPGFLPVGYCVV